MPDIELAIRAGRVITPEGARRAAVLISGGAIQAVTDHADPAVTAAAEVVDLAGDEVLLPGLVDTHVHVNEPGRTEWEGFATATLAAAAGGVTTVIDMPLNSIPPTIDVTALAEKRRAAEGHCYVDTGFWGGAVPGNLGRLGPLLAAGVFGFKCFTIDSGVPEFPPLDPVCLRVAVAEAAGLGCPLLVHAEDAAIIAAAADRLASAGEAKRTRYREFLRSRPGSAEVAAIATLIGLARATGGRVHVPHLSSADAVPLLAAAQRDGVAITAETCPHYLCLAAEEIEDRATEFKCCPPIRDRANSERLWAALADGVISCVVSDHSPCPPGLKLTEAGDFAAAWGGISSVQLGLAAVWTAARRRGHDLADVVAWMAAGPAALAGLAGKGGIAAGRDADLVAFAPGADFVVAPGMLATRHKLTPYSGRWLTGVVRRTWLRGALVTPGRPRGRLLTGPGAIGSRHAPAGDGRS